MGNTELKTAFKNALKDSQSREKLGLTAEILLEDQLIKSVEEFIKEKMQVGAFEKEKAFPETNVQTNEGAEDLYKRQLISELNENYIAGFATAESNIEFLKEPSFEKFFTVNSPDTISEYTQLQQQKFVILYSLFVEKYKEQQDKKQNFFEYIQKFLEKSDVNQRVQVGLESGFKFSLSLLKEIKSINRDMLINSLEYLYQTLRYAEPGSLYSTDKLSFMIDSNLNDARQFLVSIIEDPASQQRAIELAFKIILLLGIVRSNVEDLLIVATLLDKQKIDVDLRQEIELIKDDNDQGASTENLQKKNFSERKITKSGTIFYLKAGQYQQEIKQKSSFACDGQYLYMHQEGLGLLKLGTGTQGQMVGQVYQHQTEFKSGEQVSLLYLNGKLYCRADSLKPRPFVAVNTNTLEEEKEEFELEKVDQNLEWKENEETGRSLTFTPLFSDGHYIYVVSQKKAPKKKKEEGKESEEGENQEDADDKKPPMLVVECYDPTTPSFKFVKDVYLYKNEDFEPFIYKKTNSIDFIKDSSFATNGQILMIQTNNKAYFFDMKTGVRIQRVKTQVDTLDHNDCRIVYDYQNNVFYSFKYGNANTRMETFTISNFKKGGASFGFTKEHLSKRINHFKGVVYGDNVQAVNGKPAPGKLNLIQRIMKNVTTPVLIQHSREGLKDMKGENQPKLLRTLILRHIEKSCQNFDMKLEEVKSQGVSGSDVDQHMMSFFKFPNATYLTHTLFQQIQENLDKTCELITSRKGLDNLADQYSLFFILKILTANFQALSYCSIALPDLMDEDSYQQFLTSYKQCIVKVIESGYTQDFEEGEIYDEVKSLWQEIYQLCLNILSTSINLIYADNKEIIANLEQNLQNIQNEKQAENSSISLNYLSVPENSKKILQAESDELKMITRVYEQCCQIKSQDVISTIKSAQLGQDNKITTPTTLIQASNKFIKGLSEQLIVQYCALTEQVASKQQVSSSQNTERDERDKRRLKDFDILLSVFFENASNEIVNQLKTMNDSLKTTLGDKKDDQWDNINDHYEKYSAFMDQTFQFNSGFFAIISFYVQTFSVFKLKTNLLHSITQAVNKVVVEISEFYSILNKYKEKITVAEDKDKLKKFLDSFSRNLCWFIGMTAYKLIKVKEVEKDQDKKEKEQTQNEKMQELIIQSNLLSGGIENRFVTLFSQDAQLQLQDLIKISQDQKLLELLKDKPKEFEEDKIVSAIIHEGENENVDRLISYLQGFLERKVPFVPYARLSGADGMRLSRAAFAVMIKFSEFFDSFSALVDELDMHWMDLENDPERDIKMKDIIKSAPQYENISKRWENASKMRQWINEKKKNLIEKIKKEVETEYTKKKEEEKKKKEEQDKKEKEEKEAKEAKEKEAAEAEKKPAEEGEQKPAEEEKKPEEEEKKVEEQVEQIDTSSKPAEEEQKPAEDASGLTEADKLAIDEQADAKFNAELQSIFQKIVEKAEFLVKLQVPIAYLVKDPSKKKEGTLLFIQEAPTREDEKHGVEQQPVPPHAHDFDWKDRLKSWRQMQTSKGAIKSFTDRKKEIFDSSIMSILACLQSPINTQRIKKQVETVFLNANKRVAGLRLLGQLINLDLPLKHRYDLMSWFCSSLRANKNQMSHYLDDLKGCGHHQEEQARENFFFILKGLVKQLKASTEEAEIKVILNSLKWKFLARDHASLRNLEIFRLLHEGNGTKDNKLKKAWGRPLKQEVVANENDKKITKEVIDLFEQIFLLTVGRIIKPDTGAHMKLKQRGTSVPTLEKAQSVIDENVSEHLLGQAFDVIFKEFERYIKIMKMFKGVDWTIYVKMRNKERKNGDAKKDYEDEKLLDEEEEEEQKKDEEKKEEEKKDEENKEEEKKEGEEVKKDEAAAQQEPKNESEEKKEGEGEEKKEGEEGEKKEGEEGEEAKEEEDLEEKEKQEAIKKQEERAEKEMKSIYKLYSESFLKRLLRLVEIFTSIATVSQYPLSMVQKVANPYQLQTLLNLLILSSPRIKIVVLKVIQNLIKIAIPFEVFEETIKIITKDPKSQAYEILNKVVPSVQFEESKFLKFLYNYLLSVRHKMWTKSGIESEGQYAFSCELLRTLRFVYEIQGSDYHPWRKTIDSILKSFLLDFSSVQRPKEIEVKIFIMIMVLQILFGILRGCDYNGLAPFMSAVTSNKDKIQIIGFVKNGWIHRSPHDNQDQWKVHEQFSDRDLKVLGVLYNEKNKEKCEFQLYDPNDIRLQNDTSPTQSSSAMFKNQFKITAEILNHLLEDSELLQSVDEDDIGNKQLDIFKLNTRTIIMKLINHQLQTNSQNFLKELKSSDFYQSLLKFVCKESSLEMKGDIMLLEWLEYRCFSIRKYACENQQSLVKQRDVHMTLVKDKIYVSFQHPFLKQEKQLNGVQLKSAINYKNFEEKKEVKLIHSQDVFISQGDQQGQAQKQIVLIDPESLARNNGLDIINACEGAITYNVDLNKLIKNIFVKQREDRDKYIELAQKTIFLISEEDFQRIIHSTQSSTFKRSATMKQNQNAFDQQLQDDNFDQMYVSELVNYGGFHPSIAKKTLEKEGVEQKTEHLVQLCKQLKEGILEVEEQNDVLNNNKNGEQNQINLEYENKYTKTEEKSESLQYLKQTFMQYMERQHSDKQEKSSKDALYEAINSFSKADLASEYEKSLIRLFNMYCRHVFWSLIQKDDIETIFSMVLHSQNDMRSFGVFLKVLGNECFITGNKVYIKSFKNFLKKVVDACCKVEQFRPLLQIIIEEGIIKAYSIHMEELKTDQHGYSVKRIEEQFKTESKAAQLMNPFIIVPLLRQIIANDSQVYEQYVDRLVSILVSINCLFIGNYKLKDQIWELIISILEKVRVRLNEIPKKTVKSLLKLKVVEHIFKDFDEQSLYEREEAEYAKRILKDNNAKEIDGISRRDVEKLVYAKRALCVQNYIKYNSKENSKILIEMLYNLMTHIDLYSQILEQGKEGILNEYLLFYNKLTDQQKIVTHHIESSHKQQIFVFQYLNREYEGKFVSQVQYPKAAKLLVNVNDNTNLRQGAAILISSDKNGENVGSLIMDSLIKKEQAFLNVYSDKFYMHYPVYPSVVYQFGFQEENPQAQLIEQPFYKLLERVEDQNIGRLFVAPGNKLYQWRNEELRRYKDHLDIQQITFGKQCRVMLLKNGKVWAEGRNKARHFIDNEQEQSDQRGVEIPFYEKKDKIVQLSTFFQVTIAVTEKGKIFACGDKLAKMISKYKSLYNISILEIDNSKFGFYEVPLQEEVKKEEEKKEEVKEENKQEEQKQEDQQQEEQKQEGKEQVQEQNQEEVKVDDVQLEAFQEEDQQQQPEIQQEEQKEQQQEEQQQEQQPVQQQEEEKKEVDGDAPVLQEEQKVDGNQEEQQEPVNENQEQEVQQIEEQKEQQQQVEEVKQVEVEQNVQEEQKNEQEEEKVEENQVIEEEMDQINTESKEAQQQGQLFAIRVWACKTVNTTDFVYLALVENMKTNKLELRSLGQSQYGNLGQGPDVKVSTSFKKVDFKVEIRSLNDVVTGYDHTMVVAKDGKVYGWGCYSSDEKHNFKPVHIPFFDKFEVIKLCSNQRTVALISPKEKPNLKLIVVGKFAPMVKENQVKTFNMFQNYNVYNIQPLGDKIIVSVQGDYKYRKPITDTYQHKQNCEICTDQIVGLLHFFKDKESVYHYFCFNCVKNGQMSEKYQPDLMWTIKRPIINLESKPWPEYDPQALLSDESRNVILYLTRYKINGKEYESQYSLDEISEPQAQDINPMIYLRISRPLKDDTKIDQINLSSFYEQTQHYGLSINVTPDYGFNENSQELISKNQQIYDEFKKAINEIQNLESELVTEFKQKIEEFIAKKTKDQIISDVKYTDIKFTDELKFRSDKLNELSDDCKRYYIGKYIQYLQYLWGAFTYILRKPVYNQRDLTLLSIFNQHRSKVPLYLKNKLFKKLVEGLPLDDSTISIHVNRKKARDFFDSGKIDEKGELTIFAQVWRGLASRNYQGMRVNSAEKKAWFVKFIGEFALDQGGLFRESLTELCYELQSHVLNLLIPTQNQKNNHGENRDKWTVNPGATTPTQLKMFEFLGALIGMSVRTGILMNLNLPAFFWKQLTQEEITVRDLKEIDTMTVTILEDLKDIQKKMSEEAFLAGYELHFTAILSNGEEVELIPGGKKIRVNFSNIKEYIDLSFQLRLNECKKQMKSIKKGINKTFESNFLRMLSWQDLEYKVVGKDIIDIERLKELTVYRNCNEQHDTIKKYWKIMNNLSNEEKTLYLKFVWGRTRLPLKEEETAENHTIQMDENAEQAKLPIGRTCFFRLEIPPYKNEDVFKDKLIYAIRHCTAIDADIEGAVQQEEEHHQHERREIIEDENDDNEEHEEIEGGGEEE